MATTKKSTKATSKTSKKSAAKKTSSAAKTTKASTSKAATKAPAKKATTSKKVADKTAAAKVNKKSTPKVKDRKRTLRRLNWLAVLVGVAGAAAAAFLMNQTAYQLFTSFLTTNPLNNSLAPAVHVVYDVELRWIVVGILALSALIPLFAATRNRKQYETALDNKVMRWRWIDTAIVGGLVTATIALISGVQDIMTLLLAAGFVVVMAVLGYMAEKQNVGSDKVYRGSYLLGLLSGLMPWLLIAVYAIGTSVWGMTHNSWAVYTLYITTILSFGGMVLAQLAYIDRKADYDVTEQRYLVYGLLAKVAFVLLLVLGFKK